MHFKWKLISSSLLLILFWGCTPDPEYGNRSFEDKSREVFIINSMAESISVYHPDTGTLYDDAFLTGASPNDLLYYNDMLFIVCSLDNSIQIVNESLFQKEGEIYLGVGKNPYSIIPGSLSEPNTAFVPNYVDESVSVINLDTQQEVTLLKNASFNLDRPQDGTVVGDFLFICNTANSSGTPGEGSVSVFKAVSPYGYITSISTGTGSNPQTATGFPAAQELHVYLTGDQADDDGEVLILNISDILSGGTSSSEIHRIAIGGSPAFNRDGYDSASGTVYLTGTFGLYYYDASTPSLPGDNPLLSLSNPLIDLYAGAVYDSTNNLLIVANFGGDSLLILDTQDSYNMIQFLSTSDGPLSPHLIIE